MVASVEVGNGDVKESNHYFFRGRIKFIFTRTIHVDRWYPGIGKTEECE